MLILNFWKRVGIKVLVTVSVELLKMKVSGVSGEEMAQMLFVTSQHKPLTSHLKINLVDISRKALTSTIKN